MKLHIGIDLDNTILDATTAHLHYYNLASGRAFKPEDVNDFFLYRLYEWDEAEREAVYERYGHDIHYHSEPLPMAAEHVRVLFQRHHISVITARPSRFREVTVNWLERYGFPYHDIFFCEDKLEVCATWGVDVLIDDGPHYAESFADAGKQVILLDQPYNLHVRNELVYRASDWREVRGHIDALLVSHLRPG